MQDRSKSLLLRALVRVRADGSVRWPFSVWPADWWWLLLRHPLNPYFGWFSLFRNRPGVVKRERGRWLPRRWGFRVLGFEFGDRG